MYNHEQKERFIKDYTTSVSLRTASVTMFNAFEPYEEEWGADICTRDAETLQPVIDDALGIRSRSKTLRMNILRAYMKWCISNHIPGACDGISHVDTTGVEKMKKQTIKSPFHLQVCLNQVFEPEEEQTSDNIYRCFYWLAYAGFSEDDIFEIRSSEVDFVNMVIRHGKDEYPIYREAIPTLRNCVELTRFVYKHPNYSSDKVTYKDRADGDILLRGIGVVPGRRSFRVRISRMTQNAIKNGKTETKLSYYRVWLSGLFYRMFERECAGLPVDFLDTAIQFTEGKSYKLDRGRNTIHSYQRRVAKSYKQDYDTWKKTF